MEIQKIIKIINLIDLTSLTKNETKGEIISLCKKAHQYNTASVCIYPQYIPIAYDYLNHLNSAVKIATVINFPDGTSSLDKVLLDTQEAINNHADEIDLVMNQHIINKPKHWYDYNFALINQARKICENRTLKVIIESGNLTDPQEIYDSSELVCNSNADFIKTSTGKTKVGATISAANIILMAIKNNSNPCGLKVSGGIKTYIDAIEYINLVESEMGEAWVNPNNFRIGASSLLDDLISIQNNCKK